MSSRLLEIIALFVLAAVACPSCSDSSGTIGDADAKLPFQ